MFLSFIIPIYNASAYLEECILSCYRQDIPLTEYEVICVDDGSTDESLEIIHRLSENRPNIKLIHQNNSGVGKARNTGLEAAAGDYIWFVDADDIVRENCLSTFRQLVYEKDLDRLSFRYYRFSDESAEERNAWLSDPEHRKGAGYDNMVWPNLFSRDFILREKVRFETDIPYGEDTLFVFLLQLAKPKEMNLDEAYYFWRQHSASATKQHSEQKKQIMIRSYFKVASFVHQAYENCSDSDLEMKSFIADKAFMLELKALEQLAKIKQPAYSQILRELRKQGQYPVKRLPEAKYTVWECAKEPSGLGAFRNILQYYSIYPWALFLSSIPYRLQRVKNTLSRNMRKNKTMSKLLNIKNKMLGR